MKTFAAGRDITFRDWHDYLLQMLQMGFIEIAYNDDRHIHVTELGQEVLFGKRAVQLAVISREDFSVKARRQRQREESLKSIENADANENIELFNKLKEVRKRIADIHHWPAYIVLSDRSLHHLAIEKPTSLAAFGNTFGIGEHKRDSFGTEFLEVIKEYAAEQDEHTFPDTATATTEKPLSYMEQQKLLYANAYAPWTEEDDDQLRLYVDEGRSVEEIAIMMERNNGAIKSRIKKLAIATEEDEPQNDWFERYEQELFRLQTEKAKIEEKIDAIRTQILQEMEQRDMDKLDSEKYSVSYYPARTVMQFDSKAFKEEHEDLYTSYCSPKEKEASIVVKRNKE